eukprot:XP_022268801.1 non-histone chromosomal protein HMG-14 isoform X1 [Canis lupus familiaris]
MLIINLQARTIRPCNMRPPWLRGPRLRPQAPTLPPPHPRSTTTPPPPDAFSLKTCLSEQLVKKGLERVSVLPASLGRELASPGASGVSGGRPRASRQRSPRPQTSQSPRLRSGTGAEPARRLSFPRPPLRRLRTRTRFPEACEAGAHRRPFLPAEEGATGSYSSPLCVSSRPNRPPLTSRRSSPQRGRGRVPEAPGAPRSARPRARPRRSPRGGRRGCPLNLLPQKWKRSQKRRRERINLQTKKCKQRGKGEQRENRLKWLTKKRKKTYLQKTEKPRTRRSESPASDEAGEKEAKSD